MLLSMNAGCQSGNKAACMTQQGRLFWDPSKAESCEHQRESTKYCRGEYVLLHILLIDVSCVGSV